MIERIHLSAVSLDPDQIDTIQWNNDGREEPRYDATLFIGNGKTYLVTFDPDDIAQLAELSNLVGKPYKFIVAGDPPKKGRMRLI